MKKLNHLLSLLACFLMMVAISLRRDGRFWGKEPNVTQSLGNNSTHGEPLNDGTDFLKELESGSVIIDTTVLGREINGYSGPTPLKIYLRDGVVIQIEALPNQDTPEFFSATLEEGFREQWYGKDALAALQTSVKPVTGATYSSTAFIQNVRTGLSAYLAMRERNATMESLSPVLPVWRPSLKFICGLVVALAAAILPFFMKHKYYRIIQLALNVIVLGFWCGAFVSHTLVVKYLAQGVQDWNALLPLILLVMAFVYPFFGRKSHYCMQACPFGSLQELAGKCTKKKLPISVKWLKRLEVFRQVLWALLLLTMWCGVGFAWMDNEPFSAFLFRTAPPIALTLAVLFALLSFFMNRPYCRFVCPTGSLLKFAEDEK